MNNYKWLAISLCFPIYTGAQASNGYKSQIKALPLFKGAVEFQQNVEILSTQLTITGKQTLAKHWHNGEEYLYLLKGSADLYIEGEKMKVLKAGSLTKIPYKKIHWAKTKTDTVEAIIFRAHERGKPVRVNVKTEKSAQLF